MEFKDLLESTKFSTRETVERLRPQFQASGKLDIMAKEQEKELSNLKQKYPSIPDAKTAMAVMKRELADYAKKIVLAIKNDYGHLIPSERIALLDGLLNSDNIIVIADPSDEHDFSAEPEKGQVIANLSRLAESQDFYHKIVCAKGLLPHEIFHIIIRMLKDTELADERMVISLRKGETITSRGMAGFMLNEGFVEKVSNEFCARHNEMGEDFYHTIGPQYIPYVNICNYMMSKYPGINYQTIFGVDYEYCLSQLTEEEKAQYQKAECISYAIRHKGTQREDIVDTKIEKVQLDNDNRLFSREKHLEATIDTLSRIVDITSEQRERLLARYYEMPDLEIISKLSESIYQVIGPDSPYYDYALTIIRNFSPTICPSVIEMKSILDKKFTNQIEGNMSLEDNHRLASSELSRFCSLFNQQGIDYYVVGALPCYLKTGGPLIRYHDDIDIMVNEEDLPKVAALVETTGYRFYDDRFPSKERFEEMCQCKPLHTVLAQNPENEFHLGFFCFRREQDKSMTVREYSHRVQDGQVITDVLERSSDPIGTALRYDEVPTTYDGVSFKTSTLENVYNLKGYTRKSKDILDMKKFEPYIDKSKLARLREHKNRNVTIENVPPPERLAEQKQI